MLLDLHGLARTPWIAAPPFSTVQAATRPQNKQESRFASRILGLQGNPTGLLIIAF